MRIVVLRTQYPVGHGFFHECTLANQPLGAAFRFIYDCGGRVKTQVDEYVRATNAAAIDVLFLSHFHADHVSGVPRLLERVHVRRAVIPHIAPLERILICFRNLADGAIDPEIQRLALDPRGFLLDHGVGEVIEVQHSNDRGGESEHDDVDVPPGHPDLPGWETKLIDGQGRVVARNDEPWPPVISDEHRVVTRTQNLVWQLGMYVRAATAGQQGLLATQTSTLSVADLVTLLSNAGIIKLRQAFQTVWDDINWTSLCLLSTLENASPPWQLEWQGPFYRGWAGSSDYRRTGWLGLGDAVLVDPDEVSKVRKHFGSKLLERVVTHSLPHHGSAENFCPQLLDVVGEGDRNLVLRYVTARDGNKKHPAPSVRRYIEEAGKDLLIVSEKPDSRLKERYIYQFR